MVLPADGHVHSEWSWDAENGSMEQTCAAMVEASGFQPGHHPYDYWRRTSWEAESLRLPENRSQSRRPRLED